MKIKPKKRFKLENGMTIKLGIANFNVVICG